MIEPIAGGLMARRYNKTLHGRSVYRRDDVPGHNVVKGYSTPGTGDGLDVFLRVGTPIYAMHAGKVTRIADPGGRLSAVYVEGSGILSIYAHIRLKWWVKLWGKIKEGQLLGWVDRKLKDPHLHLEVHVRGKALAAQTPDELARQIHMLVMRS
jgi:murein DD-endopeptidase MepM/ murein hydrolase activator NlpD